MRGKTLNKDYPRASGPVKAYIYTRHIAMATLPGTNSMIPSDNVVMGVPKKGRLYDRCMKLLAGAGMDHHRVSE